MKAVSKSVLAILAIVAAAAHLASAADPAPAAPGAAKVPNRDHPACQFGAAVGQNDCPAMKKLLHALINDIPKNELLIDYPSGMFRFHPGKNISHVLTFIQRVLPLDPVTASRFPTLSNEGSRSERAKEAQAALQAVAADYSGYVRFSKLAIPYRNRDVAVRMSPRALSKLEDYLDAKERPYRLEPSNRSLRANTGGGATVVEQASLPAGVHTKMSANVCTLFDVNGALCRAVLGHFSTLVARVPYGQITLDHERNQIEIEPSGRGALAAVRVIALFMGITDLGHVGITPARFYKTPRELMQTFVDQAPPGPKYQRGVLSIQVDKNAMDQMERILGEYGYEAKIYDKTRQRPKNDPWYRGWTDVLGL